ncbi:hypothetical protein ACROYT_G015716 [Oculina patagonica]
MKTTTDMNCSTMKIQQLSLTKRRVLMLTQFSIFGIYCTLTIISATMDKNNEERSQRGMALLNHTYKSLYTENYPSCLKECMHDSQCKSLNYWWKGSQCDLNNKTKYSADATVFSRDTSCTYMGLTREPEITTTVYRSCRHVHSSNGDGEYLIDPTLSGNPSTAYCDMTTDGGGWTAIQMMSFTQSNLRLQDKIHSDFYSLSNYSDHHLTVSSTVLQLIKNEMGFKQLRFYCYKKKVGAVFHIMTNLNLLGEAVVEYFIDDNLASTRPQACGSYTILPDDNSTMSEDCSKLGWNGTHTDGKWSKSVATGRYRIWQAIHRHSDRHRFYSFPWGRDCDDWESGEDSLSPGDTWALFVR